MYKSQLQELAQKRGWKVPQYESRKEGPSHWVEVNGTRYASEAPFFGNLKAAEQSAAKVALQALTGTTFPAESAPIGLTKNSLQEYTQKNGLPLPIYTVESSGELHSLDYTAVVEVGGVFYRGAAAKTKKEAEVKNSDARHGNS